MEAARLGREEGGEEGREGRRKRVSGFTLLGGGEGREGGRERGWESENVMYSLVL